MSFIRKHNKTEKNEDITSFINEPISGSNQYNEKPELPWINEDIESKKRTVFNLRLNGYYEKSFKHFSEKKRNQSYQVFLRNIIESELDAMIEKEEKNST
jgi:hypothetical protein